MKQRLITGILLFLSFTPLIIFTDAYIFLSIVLFTFSIVGSLEILNAVEKYYFQYDLNYKMPIQYKIIVPILSFLITLGFSNVWNIKGDLPIANFNLLYGIIAIILSNIVLLLLTTFNKEENSIYSNYLFLTVNYVGIGFASLLVLRLFGLVFILFCLLTCMATDSFAYLFGIKFGKHKMTKISPKKSWEGAIAGTIFGTVFGMAIIMLFGYVFKGNLFNINNHKNLFSAFNKDLDIFIVVVFGIILSFTISVACQVGDLVASKIKRNIMCKDFGKVFPGHGGILDRFDSAIFSSMVLNLFIIIFYMVL